MRAAGARAKARPARRRQGRAGARPASAGGAAAAARWQQRQRQALSWNGRVRPPVPPRPLGPVLASATGGTPFSLVRPALAPLAPGPCPWRPLPGPPTPGWLPAPPPPGPWAQAS